MDLDRWQRWPWTPAERFVRSTVGGGVALVAGLWITTLLEAWSPPWLLGAALVLLGVGGLARGIRIGLDG